VTLIHHSAREIHCKVVYYGPGLGGKTTNLRHVHQRAPTTARGRLISISTDNDRTLFFDFLPLELGTIRGFRTRFHLYTVPGQVFYDASRKLILKGVDGIVMVADSQEMRQDANIESIQNLKENLQQHGYELENIPYVLQLNKRDLPSSMPPSSMEQELRVKDEPVFEAVATQGKGVFDTLKGVIKLVLSDLRSR
jgi:signal recognition particle receptor subunit beta